MGLFTLKHDVTEPDTLWDNFRKIMNFMRKNSMSDLIDISETSTIVGWSTLTTKKILMAKQRNILTLFMHIEGTSNDSQATFTLPSNIIGHPEIEKQWEEVKILNNGAAAVGYATIEANSNIIKLYRTFSETNWTNSGTKLCIGTVIFLIK